MSNVCQGAWKELKTTISWITAKRHFVSAIATFAVAGVVFSGSFQAVAADKKVDFPAKGKSISFIVPFGAGGSTDVAARNLAPYIEKILGVPVEVINKPGAGSQIGITEALAAKPDGYTIFYANLPGPMTMYLNPDRKTTFKSKKDFTMLGIHLSDPGAIAVAYEGAYSPRTEA